MSGNSMTGTGGQVLVEALKREGVGDVFLVPGESYLAALDAFYESGIRLTVCRQEGGAAMMAGAAGRLTGRPGVCFVTRGPGATNASAGVHIAWQDSQPMVLFVGQVARAESETDAFQEVDFRRMFGPMVKWVAQIESADRVAEYVTRAFHVAMNGRPGPVVVALPEDMLLDEVDVKFGPAARQVAVSPAADTMNDVAQRLATAQRPFLLVGGVGWNQAAADAAKAFSERWAIPVATTFRCDDSFDNTHPHYAGDVGTTTSAPLRKMIEDSDLLLIVGARLTTLTSPMKSLIQWPVSDQPIVYFFPDPNEFGTVVAPELTVCATSTEAMIALAALEPGDKRSVEHASAANSHYRQWATPQACPGDVQMAECMTWLRDRLPSDAVLTLGAGNYTMWVHRYMQPQQFGSLLGPTVGAMGFGTPAAVAAQRLNESKTVIAFAGDGCFMMNGQEFATAIQYGLNLIVVVINNGMYGTIRMHQERDYPDRIMGTMLTNPDFAALGRAYGAQGYTVETTAQFKEVFDTALKAQGPALIEVRIDPEAITTMSTLSELRA